MPVREDQGDPITFANAPTRERDGRQYLTDEAAEVLGAHVAARYADLLERLSQQ